MNSILHYPGADHRPLEGGWSMASSAAGEWAAPQEIGRAGLRIPAPVPGTAAQALAAAGLFDIAHPTPLHDRDIWYFRSLKGEAPGPAILRLAGLATIAEVYINADQRLVSNSMFESHDIPLMLTGEDEIAICFRALAPHLDRRGPRARWRPQLMDHQGLRLVRTTPLGHMPGWCPPIQPVGPWRPITLIRRGSFAFSQLRVEATLDEFGSGRLAVSFLLEGEARSVALLCAGTQIELSKAEGGRWHGEMTLPGIEPWFPHTHGTPRLYLPKLVIDGLDHGLAPVGFRRIDVDRGSDGQDFRLLINGLPVFCRGAVWTSADIVTLAGDAEHYAPWLALARDAGMNMLRIGGTMAYETADFFRLCDRLGILVWQDFMFANFDYPAADPHFRGHVEREARQLLESLQGSPSLAVLCGGSEVYQQGAMFGHREQAWRGELFTGLLADLSGLLRPDVPYVENSPSGGAMAFSPNAGIAHYYGVGAYGRPPEDARRADIRFAAECLAFAHVPQQATLDRHLPGVAAVVDPRWKERVPRDTGASWDFEDVRDTYLAMLYAEDAARLRREDPETYLALSRATTTELYEQVFGEWRRNGSRCGGALVWTFQDLLPGPGWGVIDATGEPKPVWYGMKRAFRPVQILLTDEGTNGLDIHILNETAATLRAELEILCLREGRSPVVSGRRAIELSPRETVQIAATDLFGAFFDTTYAFRFGPPSHDVTVARLVGRDGRLLADAFHFPLGRSRAFHDAEIGAELKQDDGCWMLELSTNRLAQSVQIASESHRADEDWFHLAPGADRSIRLLPRPGHDGSARPEGEIRHLGGRRILRF